MDIELVYVYPLSGAGIHGQYAQRFVATYLEHQPTLPHKVTISCNGQPPDVVSRSLFSMIPNVTYFVRSNEGWDIGAYIDSARASNSKIMFCVGQSVFFHRDGWMERFMDVWYKYGPGYYGGTASNQIRPHLQTSFFVAPQWLLANYPHLVHSKESRYEFEHGSFGMMYQAKKSNLPVRMVTWDYSYDPDNWRKPDNVYWKGNQSNCLYMTNHMEEYFNHNIIEQFRMSQVAGL